MIKLIAQGHAPGASSRNRHVSFIAAELNAVFKWLSVPNVCTEVKTAGDIVF